MWGLCYGRKSWNVKGDVLRWLKWFFFNICLHFYPWYIFLSSNAYSILQCISLHRGYYSFGFSISISLYFILLSLEFTFSSRVSLLVSVWLLLFKRFRCEKSRAQQNKHRQRAAVSQGHKEVIERAYVYMSLYNVLLGKYL